MSPTSNRVQKLRADLWNRVRSLAAPRQDGAMLMSGGDNKVYYARRGCDARATTTGCESLQVYHFANKCSASKEDCAALKNMYAEREVLGSGDNGVVYTVEKDGDEIILKEIALKRSGPTKQQIETEVCIGRALGEAGIAPKIHDVAPWYCKGKGFYAMEKMDGTWAEMMPTSKVWAEKKKKPMITAEVVGSDAYHAFEKQLVGLLEMMISMGVVHNDNHPDNIGFVKDPNREGFYRAVLFDFGYALESVIPEPIVGQVLLAHLYIVLEHYDEALRDASYLMSVVYQIRQNKYKPLSHVGYTSQYYDMRPCIPAVKAKRTVRRGTTRK